MKIEEIMNCIKDICTRHHVRSYLFGSFAKGLAHKTSDIDIAVDCDDENVYWLIEDEISEIETLRKIDILYLNQPGLGQNIREDIIKYGKILSE